jgi:hypothetical protein
MKKLFCLLVLVAALSTTAFAQRHYSGDLLVGVNLGLGVSPNIGSLFSGLGESGGSTPSNLNAAFPKENYAITADFGATVDYYLFDWLSFSSGILAHPDVYMLFDQDFGSLNLEELLETGVVNNFKGVFGMPICLTIPLMAHVNLPWVDWLYLGAGINLNIPLMTLPLGDALEGLTNNDAGLTIDLGNLKGDFFIGIPIDVGFDFISPDGGGMRFILRATPEIHAKGTTVPIGFVWQIWNWKVFSL